MRKIYEIFKVLKIQKKKIVSSKVPYNNKYHNFEINEDRSTVFLK